MQMFDKSLASLNTLYGRMGKELGEVEFTKRKLQARSHWGDGPVLFLEKQTTTWIEINNATLNSWMEFTQWKIDELCKDDFGKDGWVAKIEEVVALKKTTEDTYKEEFVKGVLGEFASLKR